MLLRQTIEVTMPCLIKMGQTEFNICHEKQLTAVEKYGILRAFIQGFSDTDSGAQAYSNGEVKCEM